MALRLRPRPLPTVATIVVAAVCVRLGVWQLQRYDASATRSEAVLAAWHEAPVDVVPADPAAPLEHRRAHLRGTWTDREPQLFHGPPVAGEPGFQLVVELRQADGTGVLVDRGWVPVSIGADDLRALTPAGGAADVYGLIERADGRVDLTPTRGPDGLIRWPLETDRAYGLLPRVLGPPFGAMVAASPTPVAPWVLRAGPPFEPDQERSRGQLPIGGYVLPLPRTHHLSYAAQWFGFAGLAVVLWAWASRRPTGDPR